MIGQEKLIEYIDKLSDNFPGFVVIVGDKGSGKKTLARYIAKKINCIYAESDIKVEELREVINTAYTVKDKTLYCIPDADNMRNEAKNALLKITEESPKNAYFIMTVQDDSALLDTIKSRALVLNMEPYTSDELKTYFWKMYNEGGEEINTIIDIATTPYEVDKLVEYGKEFIDYVELVVDNIAKVQPANAFKSAGKLALKSNEGYDLKLFWNTFIKICIDRLSKDPLKYAEGVCATTPQLLKISRLGINKQQVYDKWVFDIREVWR